MAHVQDLWEKTVAGRRVRTSRYGKGNRWQARYLDPDGHERTRTFARKQDTERFIVTVRADVLRGAYVDPDAGKVSFAQFAQRWLAAQTFDESSREATELRLRLHASRHFGHRELRSIKPSVIQAWLRKLQQELAPSYVRTVFTNVSSVFNAAVDDGLITTNPCRAGPVKLPKREQHKLEPWPIEQVEAVLAALPERYRAVGVIAGGCGLRQGEVFGLRVRDVDFLRRQLHVEQPRRLLQGAHVLVMTRPPTLVGGTCSSTVAAAPQIGHWSKNRGPMRLTRVIRTGRSRVEEADVTSSDRPSGRSISTGGTVPPPSGTYLRRRSSPASLQRVTLGPTGDLKGQQLTAIDRRSHGAQTERAAR